MPAEASTDATRVAYGVDEACSALSLGRTALFDLMRTGQISSVKVGRRRLIPVAAVDAFIQRLVAEQVDWTPDSAIVHAQSISAAKRRRPAH